MEDFDISIYKKRNRFTMLIIIFSIIILLLPITASADNTQLVMNPSNITVSTSQTFTIDVYCIPSEPIKGYELKLSFDNTYIQAVSVSEGNIFSGYSTFFNDGDIDNSEGIISNIFGLIIGQGNITDSGTLCKITFASSLKTGTSKLSFIEIDKWTGVTNEHEYLEISVNSASITIEESSNPPSPPSPPVIPGSPGSPPLPPIEEENNPPEPPDKPLGPIYIELGTEYIFETYSFDIDEDLLRIKFDWGDGIFSEWSDYVISNTPVSSSYVWNEASTYEIRAIAQDINGQNSSWSEILNVAVSQVDIVQRPPLEIDFIGSNYTNENITFTAIDNLEPNISIVQYHWDFGDGNTSSGISPQHTYKHSGWYTVVLNVIDNYGNNYNSSFVINVDQAKTEFIASEKSDSTTGFPISVINIITGYFVFLIIFLIIIFRKNLKTLLISRDLNHLLKIKNWYSKRKLTIIDNKIKNIYEKLEDNDISYKIGGVEMDSSTDDFIQRYSIKRQEEELELEEKEQLYNSKVYDYSTGKNFYNLLKESNKKDYTIEKEQFDKQEEDIDNIVDRLLLEKGKQNIIYD